MADTSPFNVLVFSKTIGYRHDSIPTGIRSIQTLLDRTKYFGVTASEDASLFTPASLTKYSAIILLQCIGDIFTNQQLDALKTFVHNGGGIDANKHSFILNRCNGRQNWKDEWYNFRSHPRENVDLKILLKGDPDSFQGGKMGEDHPLAWCQNFGGRRSFFTALGHFDEAYEDDWYMDQILRGILWTTRKEYVCEADELE
ncbi:class I glutamine amidotransferase-like protein [Phaeosphaeriaceae sp. PMI808]|nr:class I glutamine amidotransferase-like protein [Phaeosphaeriaceae sp. PMI808]